MHVKVQNWTLKSKTLNLFQGKVQNDTLDHTELVSASHLDIGFDLTFQPFGFRYGESKN
jgi:hypothetical protein